MIQIIILQISCVCEGTMSSLVCNKATSWRGAEWACSWSSIVVSLASTEVTPGNENVYEIYYILVAQFRASPVTEKSWCCNQMETLSALLPLCEGNPPVIGGFPSQRSVTRSFDVFIDLHLNKQLSKQSRLRYMIWNAIALIMTSL